VHITHSVFVMASLLAQSGCMSLLLIWYKFNVFVVTNRNGCDVCFIQCTTKIMFSDDCNWDTPNSIKALNEAIFKVGICILLMLELLLYC